MEDILTAVKTSRPEAGKPEAALTAVKTPKPSDEPRSAGSTTNTVSQPTAAADTARPDTRTPVTAEDALNVLRSEPDLGTLIVTLHKLTAHNGFAGLSMAAPGPLQTQLVNVLLNEIAPNFWPTLSMPERSALIGCLRNITGINALLGKLRSLSSPTSTATESSANAGQTMCCIDIATKLFAGASMVRDVLDALDHAVPDGIKRELAQKDLVNVLSSGKIISIIAQAEDAARRAHTSFYVPPAITLSSGTHYATWLGSNIATALSAHATLSSVSYRKSRMQGGQLLAKALSLGYPSALMKGVVKELLALDESRKEGLAAFVVHMPGHAKKPLLEHLLRWLSEVRSDLDDNSPSKTIDTDVSILAAVLTAIIQPDSIACGPHLRAVLADPALSTSLSYAVRRACIKVLQNESQDELQALLETLMTTFSDRLFVAHAPVLHQESIAQTLLLAAGTLHRVDPMAVLLIARSAGHMQGTSNRLDATGQRARLLGMVVAMAISRLVDREGSQMEFGTEEMKSEEAAWYLDLVKVHDRLGRAEDFQTLLARQERAMTAPKKTAAKREKILRAIDGKPLFGPSRPPPTPAQTEVIGEKVTELLDEVSDEEDDDLKPYAKPDSDPEDSDEDATLVNRNKPRQPVYIRDLMRMLRDDKAPDRFQLGLKHAAALIRRKSNFGKEVTDHAEELMGLLCNLQDPFDTESFDELRLQAMIAVLLSDVDAMGQWLGRMVFVEGYSIAQRCIMLSALGLGGRELAGMSEDELNPLPHGTDFPSKKLPARLHATYSAAPASGSKQLESASKSLENQLIQPMALQAADQSTAHLNAVKVRTFSSRMAIERTKRKPAPNQLAKVLGRSFFYPLTNRYQQELAAYGSRSVFASATIVLVTFLKTLALLLHAGGPATMGLSELSLEFWDLLLSLRVQAASNMTVLQAVLFSMLTLLEINALAQRQADAEQGKRVMSAQEWVEMVFERAGGGEMTSGGSEEEAKIRTLAAGVLVKMREVVEGWQKQMLGSGGSG